MKIDSFSLYTKPFTIQGKVLVIPELWATPDWNDELFFKYIRPYVVSQFSSETYADDDFLKIIDLEFFNEIRKNNFFTIFKKIPKQCDLSYKSFPYDLVLQEEVLNNLVFLGWIPMSETGSAFIDGLYPISIVDNIIIHKEESPNIYINQYGLIDDIKLCEYLCNLNNDSFNCSDMWYICGIYVDNYTFEFLNQSL